VQNNGREIVAYSRISGILFPADEIEAFKVSKDVGNVPNNSSELLNFED
jgi:hypothetical protein